jgi:hypothetical protein
MLEGELWGKRAEIQILGKSISGIWRAGAFFLRREQNGKKDKDDFRCDVCDVRRRLLEYNKRCRRERPWPLRQAQGRLARKISGMPLAAEA